MNWDEACRIMGIALAASEQEIHEQYLYKVQILHPDGNANKPPAIRKRAEEELKQVNEAYQILKNPGNNPLSSPPKLGMSIRRIRFKEVGLGQKKTATFEVKSIGGPYSNIWIDDCPAPWLRVTDIKSLTSEALPIKVTMEAVGSSEYDKHYACSLALRLENEQTKLKDEATIRVELWMKGEPGALSVEANSPIRFRSVGGRGATKPKSLEISNTGHGLLQGRLSTTRNWLSVSPNSVSIAPSSKATYRVTLADDALSKDPADKAFIIIATNGGTARVRVELSASGFSAGELQNSFIILGVGYLIILTAVFVLLAYYAPTLLNQPLVWAVVSISLALIGGLVYWQRSPKTRKKR